MKRQARVLALLLFLGSCVAAAAFTAGRTPTPVAPAAPTAAPQHARTLASHTLGFVPAAGRVDGAVSYTARALGGSLYFTDAGPTFALPTASGGYALKLGFVGGKVVHPVAITRLPARISYFSGPKSQWKTGLPTYAKLAYRNVWPGIDVVFSGRGSAIEYTFVVHPGADPSRILLAYRGAASTALAGRALDVRTPAGTLREQRPVAYQQLGSRRVAVRAEHRLGGGGFGFGVGAYDTSKTLVIDPVVVVYAGFVGGIGADVVYGVDTDSSGNAYVTGWTDSTEATFPVTAGAYDGTFAGGTYDAFVAKLTKNGAYSWVSYIGGSLEDRGYAIKVDSSGNTYVGGLTYSTQASFPVTAGAYDVTQNGSDDGFVAKLGSGGTTLDWCTYLGGSQQDGIYALGIDSSANVYVGGGVGSADFPTVGTLDTTYGTTGDGFVTKIDAGGATVSYSGYVGGAAADTVRGILVTGSPAVAYLVGETSSAGFPFTTGAYNSGTDAFVAKVNSAGSALTWARPIAGSGDDYAYALIKAGSEIDVVGYTSSTEASFPVSGTLDATYNGGSHDVFLAGVDDTTAAISWAGYVGGGGDDMGLGLQTDSSGNLYLAGKTSSTDFPVTVGPDLSQNGGVDAFAAEVTAGGGTIAIASFLGGSGDDTAWGVSSDGDFIVVAGQTSSTETDFPVRSGPDLTFNSGTTDGFVAKLANRSAPSMTASFGAASIVAAQSTTLTFTLTDGNADLALSGIDFTLTLPSGLVVATPNGVSGACSGVSLTAAAGGTSISLTGADIPASGSCTLQVDVKGVTAGSYTATTSTVSSTEAGSGSAASASLTVTAASTPTPAPTPSPSASTPTPAGTAASSDGTCTVRWPADTFATSDVTVLVTVENGACRVQATRPGGAAALLVGYLDVELAGPGGVARSSLDGIAWGDLTELTSHTLAADAYDGAYRDGATAHVLTRHTGWFMLEPLLPAPAPLTMSATVSRIVRLSTGAKLQVRIVVAKRPAHLDLVLRRGTARKAAWGYRITSASTRLRYAIPREARKPGNYRLTLTLSSGKDRLVRTYPVRIVR